MTVDSRVFGLYAGIFGVIGIAFGLTGFLSIRWAESVYISAASGDIVQTLGPVFAGVIVLQNTIVLQFLSLVLVLVFGFLFGSEQLARESGALVGGVGGLVGHLSLTIPSVLLVIVAPSEAQAFAPPSMLTLAISTLILAGIAGAVSGYVGSAAS